MSFEGRPGHVDLRGVGGLTSRALFSICMAKTHAFPLNPAGEIDWKLDNNAWIVCAPNSETIIAMWTTRDLVDPSTIALFVSKSVVNKVVSEVTKYSKVMSKDTAKISAGNSWIEGRFAPRLCPVDLMKAIRVDFPDADFDQLNDKSLHSGDFYHVTFYGRSASVNIKLLWSSKGRVGFQGKSTAFFTFGMATEFFLTRIWSKLDRKPTVELKSLVNLGFEHGSVPPVVTQPTSPLKRSRSSSSKKAEMEDKKILGFPVKDFKDVLTDSVMSKLKVELAILLNNKAAVDVDRARASADFNVFHHATSTLFATWNGPFSPLAVITTAMAEKSEESGWSLLEQRNHAIQLWDSIKIQLFVFFDNFSIQGKQVKAKCTPSVKKSVVTSPIKKMEVSSPVPIRSNWALSLDKISQSLSSVNSPDHRSFSSLLVERFESPELSGSTGPAVLEVVDPSIRFLQLQQQMKDLQNLISQSEAANRLSHRSSSGICQPCFHDSPPLLQAVSPPMSHGAALEHTQRFQARYPPDLQPSLQLPSPSPSRGLGEAHSGLLPPPGVWLKRA